MLGCDSLSVLWLQEQYVEDSTGGLHYCRVKELKDTPTPTYAPPQDLVTRAVGGQSLGVRYGA